jgi:CheY-like chemotaxis protein
MKQWMIVEDEPDLYGILLEMTEILGHLGIAFSTGEDAIAWIDDFDAGRIGRDVPDVALIDIRMPTDISGVHVAERMRQSPRLQSCPIILMTAFALTQAERREILERSGALMIMSKPLPLPRLNKIIEEQLALRGNLSR